MVSDITHIKETCLYVSDLSRTKDFYQDLLGFELINFTPGRHVFLRAGSSVLLCFDPVATKAETQLPPHFAEGHQHLAFEVPQDRYETSKDEIISKGIEIIFEQQWSEGLYSFYFLDPDEHVLEIVPAGLWD
ncbi:MAG: VOC family protein [Bacteroidota bacterium]